MQDQYGLDNRRQRTSPKPQDEQEIDLKTIAAYSRHKTDHAIDMTGVGVNFMSLQPPPPPPPPHLFVDRVIINPVVPAEGYRRSSSKKSRNSCSTKVFTIAMLQQHTNSFSEENFVGEGSLGSVYKAELPDGKVRFFP